MNRLETLVETWDHLARGMFDCAENESDERRRDDMLARAMCYVICANELGAVLREMKR